MPSKGQTIKGKPDALKVGGVNGTRERRKNEARGRTVKRVPGIPDPPPYLDKRERDAWLRFGEVLGEQGRRVMTKHEFAAFEALVCSYAKFQQLSVARREVQDDDVIGEKDVYNKQGDHVGTELRVHPIYAAMNAAETVLMQNLGRFGLTPADFQRAGEAGTEGPGEPGAVGQDPYAEFRN